jgi:ribosomal protein S18 acetylase RimI-like enzyme
MAVRAISTRWCWRLADAPAVAQQDEDPLRDLLLRPIREDDRDFLCALYAEVRAEELAPVPWPEAAKQAFLAQQFALQHQHYHSHYADAEFLLIERAGQPIGRIYVHRVPGEIRLMEVSLVAEARGRGIGGALLRRLIEESELDGADLTLHVEAHNPAVRLYRRHGFEHREDRGVYQFYGRRPAGGG